MSATPNFDKAELSWSMPWEDEWVTAVAFLGPTRKLAAGNQLGDILVWDLPEKPGGTAPTPALKLKGHDNTITRLLSTSDGKTLISSSYDRTIRYWNMGDSPTEKTKIAVDVKARAAAAKSGKKGTTLPDIEVGVLEARSKLTGHREWILGMSMTPDDKILVAGDDSGDVVVWDRAAGKEIRRWKTKGWVYAVAVSPDASQVLVSERLPLVFDSGRHAGVKIWDAGKGEMLRDLGEVFLKEHQSAAAYSPDGKILAIGRGGESDGNSGKVTLIDPSTGKKIRDFTPGHLNGLTDLTFHPDGKHIASCGRDTVVRLWQISDGKMVKELGKPRGGQFKDWLHSLSISPDGLWLAAADMAGLVHVWNFPA